MSAFSSAPSASAKAAALQECVYTEEFIGIHSHGAALTYSARLAHLLEGPAMKESQAQKNGLCPGAHRHSFLAGPRPHASEIRASLPPEDQFSPEKVMKSEERKLNPGNSLLRSQIRHLDNELELLIAAQPFIHMTHYLAG